MPVHIMTINKDNADKPSALASRYREIKKENDVKQFTVDFMRSNADAASKKIFSEILYLAMKDTASSESEKALVSILEPERNEETIRSVFSERTGEAATLLEKYFKNKSEHKNNNDPTFLNFKKLLKFHQGVGNYTLELIPGMPLVTKSSNIGHELSGTSP